MISGTLISNISRIVRAATKSALFMLFMLFMLSMLFMQLESEFAKLPQSAGRTMTERKRKQELEGRIEDPTKKIRWLRMELRERHVLHK